MAQFSKLVVTEKGNALIAKALANTAAIKFTKVSSSAATYELSELEGLESFTDIRQTHLKPKVQRINNTSVEVKAAFNNTELTNGYYIRAFGLYADDPDEGEILYGAAVETSGNCYMPAYNGVTSSGVYLRIVTTVGNSQNVSLEIDPAAVATLGDIEEIREKFEVVVFDDSGEVEGIESFEDFMASFIKETSIYKLFANLKAGLKYVLHAGKLVNSGMCETPGAFALDAAYGKTLTDQVSGLYSEIQDLQNGLSALDTRVTNAITGGDLAAPYTLNFLNTPYTDVGANPYGDPDYKTNFTTSTPTAWAATQPKGSSGYSATVYRNYQTTVKIGKNYKLKYNFSGTYSNAMGEGLSLLLCEGSTVLQKIKANGSGNTHTASGELDLSLYVGKTVNIKFMVVTWTGYGFSAAFNTLSITNK